MPRELAREHRVSSEIARNSARREISQRIVALLKESIGRGPTSARTLLYDDLVLVVLSDTLTQGERVLADDERVGLVREMRRAFVDNLRDEIQAVIAEATGRGIKAMLSDHSVEPDYAIAAFVLENFGEGAPQDSEELSFPTGGEGHGRGLERRREISRGMVGIYKDFIGRGPTNVRSYVDEDIVAVLLTDTMTKVEQSLTSDERTDSVREMRRQFQGAIKEKAVALIEEATGHKIIAFLSDHAPEPDYAVEVFVLDGPIEDAEGDLSERAESARSETGEEEA